MLNVVERTVSSSSTAPDYVASVAKKPQTVVVRQMGRTKGGEELKLPESLDALISEGKFT